MRDARALRVVACALTCFSLQASIPAGFMPSNLLDGGFVEFCPDGLPADIAALFAGETHHHHGEGQPPSFLQCDLGGGPGSLPNIEFTSGHTLASTPGDVPAQRVGEFTRNTLRYAPRPRAPPFSRSA